MADVEVTLADQTYSEIENLVEQGEFLNWEQAAEELLSMGLSAYDVEEESPEDVRDELFTNTIEEQQDPALSHDQQDDEPTF